MIQGLDINDSASLSGLHCVEKMHTTEGKLDIFHTVLSFFIFSLPFSFNFSHSLFFFNLSHSFSFLSFFFCFLFCFLLLSLALFLIHSLSCLLSLSLTPWGFILEGRKKNLSSLKNEIFLTEALSAVFSMSTSSKLWRSLIRRKGSLKMIWTYLLGVHSSNT